MTYDIIIIGAGIVGLSTAYQIARRSSLSVLVLEKSNTLGSGSTGASSAICRHRYSQDEMITLARDGILAYRNWTQFTGIAEPKAEYHQDGVLWINNEGATWAKRQHTRLMNLDVEALVLSQDELNESFPSISTCLKSPDLKTGLLHRCTPGNSLLFEPEAGYFEPIDALNDLLVAATRDGVEIMFNSLVNKVSTRSGRATGVQLESGEQIDSGLVINVNGPWCNHILAPLGLADRWPLKPTRIQVIHINRPHELHGKIPVCCDSVSGVYFREQNRGQQIIIGSTREEDEREVVNPSNYNDWVDDKFKATRLHGFAHRFPNLPDNLKVTSYTGLYTVNQTDVHPVVGETEIHGFYLANGFSGHGFKIAPAIGAQLAREVTGAKSDFDTEVQSNFLAFDRRPLSVDGKNVLA